ncbi:MAG: sulfatase-like hydrolase/transferase [Gemmatimonadaceae bacterium]
MPSPAHHTFRLRDVLIVVACAALAGALAEFSWILGARILLQRYTLLNPQGLWLAPLANFVVMAPPVLLTWGLLRWRRSRFAMPGAIAVAAFLAVLEPLLVLTGRLHIVAMFILSAGVATQAAWITLSRPALIQRWSPRVAIGLAAVVLAGALSFNGLRSWRERRAVLQLATARDGAPNVLILVLDTVRALSLSAYGYGRSTSPALARLAERGVRFEHAVATAPWTLPTHATLFTGKYPHELSAGWSTPLDRTYPTLAERLTSLGYVTAGFAANLRYCSYEFGLSRGFGYYRDYDVSVDEMWRTSSLSRAIVTWLVLHTGGHNAPGRQSAERINERVLDWLDSERRQDSQRPFFLFANYYDAHGPYAPPAPYDTMFSGKEPPTRDSGSNDFTAEEVKGLLDAYDGSIAYLDRQIGELLTALEQRGLLENTVIVVTSDHGEEFNEHGQMNHGNTLYFPSLHVPLIFAGTAQIPRGVSVADPVTLRDVPATVLDLVGSTPNAALPGHSFAWRWRDQAASFAVQRDWLSPIFGEVDHARNLAASIPVSQGAMKSVVVDGHHYIRSADGSEELYDVLADPWERANVLSKPELGATLERARSLVDRVRDSDVRRPTPKP